MATREEHLRWCKERAMEYVHTGDLNGALASMISDLSKWDGGELYDRMTLQVLITDGMLFSGSPERMRHWIEGFN